MEPVAVAVVVGVLLALVLTVLALGWSRRRTLTSRVGSFLCQLDEGAGSEGAGSEGTGSDGASATGEPVGALAGPQAPVTGTAGVGQYCTGRLEWWRAVSLAPRAARTWDRARLEVLGRVELEAHDAQGRPLVRLRCRHGGQVFDLTLAAGAAAGLVSWLESAPRSVGRVT